MRGGSLADELLIESLPEEVLTAMQRLGYRKVDMDDVAAMHKAVGCLSIQVPLEVYHDINGKWQRLGL